VAILVRDDLGLHMPERGTSEVYPARAVAGIMEIPGRRPCHLTSCYLRHGGRAAEGNAAILAEVGASCRAQGDDVACVVGGDFNMSPEEMIGTGFDREAELTLFHDDSLRGTFRTVKAASTIDYFFVSDRLAPAVEAMKLVEASSIKGHLPVQVRFKPELASLKALYLRPPPRLPLERVYGPIPPPPSWTVPAAVAEAALAGARAKVSGAEVDDLLEQAYSQWAHLAEEELQSYTGTVLAKRGERSLRPRLVWRSVIPEKKFRQGYPKAAAATWLNGIAGEVVRIIGEAKAAVQTDVVTETDGMDDDLGQRRAYDQGNDADGEPVDQSCDGEEGDDGEEITEEHVERRRRRPPADRRGCLAVLEEIRASLQLDAPTGEPDDEMRAAIGEAEGVLEDLVRATGLDGREEDVDAHGRPGSDALRGGWSRTSAAAAAGCLDAAMNFRTRMQAMSKSADAQLKNEEGRRWKEWLLEDFGAGASRAHAATKIPQEMVPVAARTEGGTMSSAPDALLDEQRRRFREM
jgi:hypothetical protein